MVRYYGQYVAVVVALTFEQATAAANAVVATYEAAPINVSTKFSEAEAVEKPTEDSKRGDPDAAFKTAPVKIDQTVCDADGDA